LQVVEQVGVGGFAEDRPLVIRLEGFLNIFGVVGKVEHKGFGLAGANPVEPREGLHRMQAFEAFIHIHGVQQGLIEAGLEFFGHNQNPVFIQLEGGGGLRFGDAVHAALGIFNPAIFDGAREGHQRPEGIAMLLQVGIYRLFVAHGVQPGTGDDHCFGVPPNAPLHLPDKMLHNHFGFFANGVFVQIHKRHQQTGGFAAIIGGVILDLFEQAPVRFEGGVVLQHVEDEIFFNGLPHGVQAERRRGAARVAGAKQFQGCGFGGGSKGKVAGIGQLPPAANFSQDAVFDVIFSRGGILLFGFFQAAGSQHGAEVAGGLARLRGVGLINDDGIMLARQAADLL